MINFEFLKYVPFLNPQLIVFISFITLQQHYFYQYNYCLSHRKINQIETDFKQNLLNNKISQYS